jgi:molybdopterin/thiamine biosynthesis adenylyltransferase/rhodanese-related sulfurtransferase
VNTQKDFSRYDRQTILQGFGAVGQQKLSAAKVLVIGAGGLGCPALQYLVAAGLGHIGIVDHDVVSLSNLHRQVLFTSADVDTLKVDAAGKRLREMNPDVDITTYPVRLDVSNALTIISNYDIVLDGTDNFSTRYLVNDACRLLIKPLVFGAVSQFEGQVTVFNVPDLNNNLSNYRDLFPDPPGDDEIPNCAQAGVIGVLPGIVGTMQAAEVIKFVTGLGTSLAGRLLTFNILDNQFYEVAYSPSQSESRAPSTKEEFETMHYQEVCGMDDRLIVEIDWKKLKELLSVASTLLVDVRETNELPRLDGFSHEVIPMSRFYSEIDNIDAENVILVCQHGIRSVYAAELLQEEKPEIKRLYSLKGGISRWSSEL